MTVHERAATVATVETHVLAEGPVWDPRRGLLFWVDISQGSVLGGRLADDGTIDILDRFDVDGTVGAVAPSTSGAFLLAQGDDLVEVTAGEVVRRIPVVGSRGGRRFNDGKADAAGRFLVGTLSLSGASDTEQLFIVERDGTWRVLDDDLTLSNGLAWSVDGGLLYSVDTMRRVIFVRSYATVTGETGTRTQFVQLADGYPDGICIDAEDHLWVAVWGLGQVHRYSPAGELVEVVHVPAPHTSSVAFAGPFLDTLVVTTASDGLTPGELAAFPLSGHLFTLAPGVAGLPQPLWDGFTPPIETDTA